MKNTYTTPGLDIEEIMQNATLAAEHFATYSQEETDKIVAAVYREGFNNRIRLAKMAYEETKLGRWEDKARKNTIATRFVYEDIKDRKTVGVVAESDYITEIARPLGPVFCITPITNPTSTVLFKILIALKTRNPIIIRPHGTAKKCSNEAARICYEAALEAGAPENCIQWIPRSTQEETIRMMGHKKVALVLATGSVSLVRAAYHSGNPAIGVGPGNVPVYIGKSANVELAVDQILHSKLFDYGTVCASEQAVVVSSNNAENVREEFRWRKAYFLNEEEKIKVGKIAINQSDRVMNAEVIGQPAWKIAKMAGIDVPEDTSVLIAEYQKDQVGFDYPLSLEILAPILAFYEVGNFREGIEMCRKINKMGGLGHTVSIFSNDEEKIKEFATIMNAGRILVNTPASQGALGGTFNMLQPSMTLACGSGGKNITTDNISVQHLLNIQRIARRRVNTCVTCDHLSCSDESVDADLIRVKCEKQF